MSFIHSLRGAFWRFGVGVTWLLVLFAVTMPTIRRVAMAEDYAVIPDRLADYDNPHFQDAVRASAPDYDHLYRSEQVREYLRAYRQLNQGQSPQLSPSDASFIDGAQALGLPGQFPPLPAAGGSAAPPPLQANPDRLAGDDNYTFIPGYGYHYSQEDMAATPTAGGGSAANTANPPVPPQSDSGFHTAPFSTDPFVAKPHTVDQLHTTQIHVDQVNTTQLHSGPN